MARVTRNNILQPSSNLRQICFMDEAKVLRQAGGIVINIQPSRGQYRFLIILMELIAQSNPAVRVKTCFSVFQHYCQTRDQNCWQMEVVKKRLNSTTMDYKSKGKLKKTEGRRLNMSNRSVEQKKRKDIITDELNAEEKQGSKDITLFDVFKVKIHSNDRYNRTKTEYTVNRNNFKTFLKLKQVQQFNHRQNIQASNNLQKKFQLNWHKLKKSPLLDKTEKRQQIIVELKRRPVTNTDTVKKFKSVTRNVDDNVSNRNGLKHSLTSNKVIFSSKNCPKFRTLAINDNKSYKQISGWQIKEDAYVYPDQGDLSRSKSKNIPN